VKFIYITHKIFPARSADDFYSKALAKAFNAVLGDKFLLVLANNLSNEIDDVNHSSLGLKLNINKHRALFYLYYIWWIPQHLLWGKKTEDTVFFVGDQNIALILIFLRKFFRLKYKIYTDWHMFFDSWKYKFMAENSDFLVSTSLRLKKNIIEKFNIKPEKIKVVYGGVDLTGFEKIKETKSELRKDLGLPVDDILVSYVGFFKTMSMEKGVGTMIKSLTFIEDPRIKMAFVGGKEEQIEEYKKLATEIGVEDRVIFIGVVPNDKIPLYETAMDILVIPYPDKHHFREYGFPMKVYEYMASQRPIIYSKLELIEEMLSGYGFSFNPDIPEDLASVINNLMSNSDKSLKVARNAYEKVLSYSWENKAKEIINFNNTL
jgi:glycosyltransferase involved in cell wall biosynthesis